MVIKLIVTIKSLPADEYSLVTAVKRQKVAERAFRLRYYILYVYTIIDRFVESKNFVIEFHVNPFESR